MHAPQTPPPGGAACEPRGARPHRSTTCASDPEQPVDPKLDGMRGPTPSTKHMRQATERSDPWYRQQTCICRCMCSRKIQTADRHADEMLRTHHEQIVDGSSGAPPLTCPGWLCRTRVFTERGEQAWAGKRHTRSRMAVPSTPLLQRLDSLWRQALRAPVIHVADTTLGACRWHSAGLRYHRGGARRSSHSYVL